MHEDLPEAHALIDAYEAGDIDLVPPVTEDQRRLLHLLADDLGVSRDGVSTDYLIRRIAGADRYWNDEFAKVAARHCELVASGRNSDARTEVEAFMSRCPSRWYRDMMSGR
jgi:hypothetical protein